MFHYHNQIADLHFHIQSDIPIPSLEEKRFEKFNNIKGSPHIFNHFHFVNSKINQNLAYSKLLNYCITKNFYMPPQIDNSIVTIYPFLLKHIKKNYSNILASNSQLKKIFHCLEHPDDTFIILHQLFIEIRDYNHRSLDIFYPKELVQFMKLNHNRIGLNRMFSLFLPTFTSLMIHSSAVALNGKAACFVAPSGGGKTTIARLASNNLILSDDNNIIRSISETMNISASPWGRVIGSTKMFKLGGLFVLKKADSFSIKPLNKNFVIPYIWNENRQLWMNLPPKWRMNAFDLLCSICKSIPLYELSFQHHYVDWDEIYKSL